MKKNANPLEVIHQWFIGKCDHFWEHQYGLILETTDNPGWWLTIDETATDVLLDHIKPVIRKSWDAECVSDSHKLKIYAPSLDGCISATAYILTEKGRDAKM
jgi:hypothetical protein